MKNLMFKKICLLLVAGILLMAVAACTANESLDPTPSDPDNQGASEVENDCTYFSYDFAVKDGKVLPLLKEHSLFEYSAIDNAVSVYEGRFVLCDDGKFKDLYDSESKRELYPTNDLIDELNEGCGIWKIECPDAFTVKIYANDGKMYKIKETTVESMAADSGLSVEEFLQTYDPASRVKVSEYEKTESKKEASFTEIVEGKAVLYKIVLNDDSTVLCLKYVNSEWAPYEGFSEFAEWKNIVDIVAVQSVIIGLQEDGKVLSVGTDFSVDNAVKIDIIDNYNIPVALTADGKLVFDETQYFADVLIQASEFTDVADFTYYDGSEFVILAQKSDGTLIATTNDVYNPEYVCQPE